MSKSKQKFINEIQARIARDGYAIIKRSSGMIFIPDQARSAASGIQAQDAEFHFRMTDESADDYNTVFKASGWNMQPWLDNPIITAQHPYLDTTDTNLFIGRGTYVVRQNNEWYCGVNLQKNGNPVAEDIRQKLVEGIWSCCSIYARVHDYRMGDQSLGEDPALVYFTEQTLIALGIVAKGSNANSTLLESTSTNDEEDPKPMDEEESTDDTADDKPDDKKEDDQERLSQLAGLTTMMDKITILKTKLIA